MCDFCDNWSDPTSRQALFYQVVAPFLLWTLVLVWLLAPLEMFHAWMILLLAFNLAEPLKETISYKSLVVDSFDHQTFPALASQCQNRLMWWRKVQIPIWYWPGKYFRGRLSLLVNWQKELCIAVRKVSQTIQGVAHDSLPGTTIQANQNVDFWNMYFLWKC